MGLRDPSHANTLMAIAELAHYASLPPADVERMLHEGELEVQTNLDRAEAERAAYELNERGAVVDLRLTPSSSGVFPVLKPDADRQIGVAVGGLIDDSATPPTVGDVLHGLPELEPDPEAPIMPRARRNTPGGGNGLNLSLGGGADYMTPSPDRPVLTRDRVSDGHDGSPYSEPGPRRELFTETAGPPGIGEQPSPPVRRAQPPRERPGEYGVVNERPRGPGSAPAARGTGAGGRNGGQVRGNGRGTAQPRSAQSRSTPSRPTPSRPAGRGADAPRASGKAARPKTQPGGGAAGGRRPSSSSAPALDDLAPSTVPANPKLPSRLEKAAALRNDPEGELELDFAAAGIKPPPRRGFGPGAQPAPPPRPAPGSPAAQGKGTMPRRTRARNMGGTGASAAGRSSEESGLLELLRDDKVAMLLLGQCIGLIVGLVTAVQIQRSQTNDILPPIEDELAQALADPDDVEAGELRSPDDIEYELSEELDAIERNFLLSWFLTGIPLGLVIARWRRFLS